MRRIVLWASSTVAALVLVFGYHTSTSGVAALAQQPIGTSLTTSTPASTSGTGPDTGTAGTSSVRTVPGDLVQTRWGPVQVEITTDGQAVTGVQVVRYPAENGRDVEINSHALPILVEETMSAQSAEIDMVSGATVTSVGYLDSLQSALDQAGL